MGDKMGMLKVILGLPFIITLIIMLAVLALFALMFKVVIIPCNYFYDADFEDIISGSLKARKKKEQHYLE